MLARLDESGHSQAFQDPQRKREGVRGSSSQILGKARREAGHGSRCCRLRSHQRGDSGAIGFRLISRAMINFSGFDIRSATTSPGGAVTPLLIRPLFQLL